MSYGLHRQTDRQIHMSIQLTFRTVYLLSENYWQIVRFLMLFYVDLSPLYHTVRYYTYCM